MDNIEKNKKNILSKKQTFLEKTKNLKDLSDMLAFNTNHTMLSPYADTTVIRTPESVIRGKFNSKENRFRSEEYLLNFRTDNHNLGFAMGIGRFYSDDAILSTVNKSLKEDNFSSIKLPQHNKLKASLGVCIENRRSTRKFSGKSISPVELSTILYYAQGISGEMTVKGRYNAEDKLKLRNTASGGGLYPIDLYIAAINIKSMEKGIYLYQPFSNSVLPVAFEINEEVLKNFAEFGEIEFMKAAFSVIYVYDFYTNTKKYGDAAMAYAFIEAGEIAQNIALSSTALGLGACDIGGYDKQYIEDFINIDGMTKHVIHYTIIGEGR